MNCAPPRDRFPFSRAGHSRSSFSRQPGGRSLHPEPTPKPGSNHSECGWHPGKPRICRPIDSSHSSPFHSACWCRSRSGGRFLFRPWRRLRPLGSQPAVRDRIFLGWWNPIRSWRTRPFERRRQQQGWLVQPWQRQPRRRRIRRTLSRRERSNLRRFTFFRRRWNWCGRLRTLQRRRHEFRRLLFSW